MAQESRLQVVACSVEADAHPAHNVLSPELYRAWQFKGAAVGSLVLRIVPPSPIFRLKMTNAGSQHVEIFASKSEAGDDDWEIILHKAMLRTQAEIKEGKARDRSREYTMETSPGLCKTAAESKWSRLKVTCSCHDDNLRVLDHLGSDGRLAQAFMGLALLRCWHGLAVLQRPEQTPGAEAGAERLSAPKEPAKEAHHTLRSAKPSLASKYAKPAASKPAPSHSEKGSLSKPTKPSTPVSCAAEESTAPTPPTSCRLPAQARCPHWKRPLDMASGSSSSFRGSAASHSIRKSLATAVASSASACAASHTAISSKQKTDPVQRDLAKRLGEFVKTLPHASLESTSIKDAKSAIMYHYDDWDAVYQTNKAFFKQKLEDLLNDHLEAYEKSSNHSTHTHRPTIATPAPSASSSDHTRTNVSIYHSDPTVCSSSSRSHQVRSTLEHAPKQERLLAASVDDPAMIRIALTRRIGEYMQELPLHISPEAVTLRQLKDAVKGCFGDWEGVWKEHKEFFKDEAMRLLEQAVAKRSGSSSAAGKAATAQGQECRKRPCGDTWAGSSESGTGTAKGEIVEFIDCDLDVSGIRRAGGIVDRDGVEDKARGMAVKKVRIPPPSDKCVIVLD